MKANYVLIDYENVQPTDVQLLHQEHFYVILFLGVNQTKIPYEIVITLQEMRERAKYVKISTNGANALDFHITFYLGRLIEQFPDAYFHIISCDTGYDPLIQHLREQKFFVHRSRTIQDMPLFRSTASTPISLLEGNVSLKESNMIPLKEKILLVRKDLQKRGESRPGTVPALFSTINALFRKSLSDDELSIIIRELHQQRIITVTETRIVYHFDTN